MPNPRTGAPPSAGSCQFTATSLDSTIDQNRLVSEDTGHESEYTK